MGNKLCAPLVSKKAHPSHSHPWHTRKNSNLIRLWAEIFCVQTHGDFVQWKRVSEDVVPINITCVEDIPRTVFQVTAYNRHIEKIFDVKITQPGTILCPATDSFVHWRDPVNKSEWGLNFTTPQDAKHFQDCCSVTNQKFSRKAASTSSLKLSPIKDKGNSVSSPNSPISDPRPAVSSSYDLNQVEPCECITPSGGREPITRTDKAATIPRSVSKPGADKQIFEAKDVLKPSSMASVTIRYAENSEHLALDRALFQKTDCSNDNHSCQSAAGISLFNNNTSIGNKETEFRHVDMLPFSRSPSKACENIRLETTFIGNFEYPCDLDQSCGHKNVTTGTKQRYVNEKEIDSSGGCENKNRNVVVHKDSIRILAPQSLKLLPKVLYSGQEFQNVIPEISHSGQGSQNVLPEFSHSGQGPLTLCPKLSHSERESQNLFPVSSHSGQESQNVLSESSHNGQGSLCSGSPECPSPSELLTFQTPQTPTYHLKFDSDSIKRMLENLQISPETDSFEDINENETGFDGCDGGMCGQNKEETSGGAQSDVPCSFQLFDYNLGWNKCVHNRNSYARDVNPDSGIEGVLGEFTLSLSSGDANAGLDVQQSHSGGSTGASCHNSSSGSHHSQSDLISQLTDGQFLSTEMSDDDTGSDGSIHTVTEAESQFLCARQHGAIRKAGWLVVKNWLFQKKKKLEMAPRRTWKKYWVCLKGTVLLFYDGDIDNVSLEDNVPKHMLVIEGAIAHAVPEHPKRENIFSLSTAFGDAYLLQATSQMELDSWVGAIHSACAGSFARQHGKENIVKLLISELQKLETNIDVDVKMRKMAELQLTVVSDPRSRQAIIKQINQWEENIEKLFIEQYRLQCYSSSIQSSELPNPKVLLSSASKASKMTLSKLGIFTVSSFHALVCARKPLVIPSLYGKGNQKGGLLYPRGDGLFKDNTKKSQFISSFSQNVYKTTDHLDEIRGDRTNSDGNQSPPVLTGCTEMLLKVTVLNNQTVTVAIKENTSADDVLKFVCDRLQLDPKSHYVRVCLQGAPEGSFYYPDKYEYIADLRCELVEVCQNYQYQVELSKGSSNKDYGLKIEAELAAEDCDAEGDLRIYITDVSPNSLADTKGLKPADEILTINGRVVSDLDMVYVESLLTESNSICIKVRSMFVPATGVIDTMLVHQLPFPAQTDVNEVTVDNLKMPPPYPVATSCVSTSGQSSPQHVPKPSLLSLSEQTDALLQGDDQVAAMCKEQGDESLNINRQLSEVERLQKVIMELVDTERAYIKDLNCLLEHYLEPLKKEKFLTSQEIDHIFGNIQEIAQFQSQFLHSLEEALQLDSLFFHGTDIKHYRRVLFSLGGSFLFYANHFKVYSSFCASHSRSQKILNPDTINVKLKEFLIASNPGHQHSSTLESYLIKPIQRILKYPLLLQQLCNLTDPNTDEHPHLAEARKAMEAVAEHINEMQKIYEEYGAIFDELSATFRDLYPSKEAVDLSVGELQMYGTVEWCNVNDSLGKVKKGTDLENTVFVFKTGVVFLCRERLKRRKVKPAPSPGKSMLSDSYDASERFRLLIPVCDVQVRIGKVSDMDSHYWWELVHSRSDAEGRPQRVYQFCNSTIEAKTDFMRIIRQTIRDSVHKMAVPNNPQTAKSSHIQNGGKQHGTLCSNSQSTNSKKRHSPNGKVQDVDRHSMELEEKCYIDESDGVFRTRSKTVGDLNVVSSDGLDDTKDIALCELENAQLSGDSSENSSCSNLSISSQSASSAKLTFSSANPLIYATRQECTAPMCSPIWKPRNENNVARHKQFICNKLEKSDPNVLLTGPKSPSDIIGDTEC